MTIVMIVPVAPETSDQAAQWTEQAARRSHGEARRAGVVRGWSAGEAQPQAPVRPSVRRLRTAGGEDAVRAHAGRQHRFGRHAALGRPRPVACDRSYEADLHGSRLTRRGKVVVAAVWLVFAVAIVFMVSRPAEVPVPAETATVTVKSGDTLWAVAGDVAPGADPRVTVEQIMELNGLRSAGDIHPGDLLVVPFAAE
ncbi:MAG TPA: LysM peptidoglycan-binding domain-containing protein [Jiangellaceae bacterium]